MNKYYILNSQIISQSHVSGSLQLCEFCNLCGDIKSLVASVNWKSVNLLCAVSRLITDHAVCCCCVSIDVLCITTNASGAVLKLASFVVRIIHRYESVPSISSWIGLHWLYNLVLLWTSYLWRIAIHVTPECASRQQSVTSTVHFTRFWTFDWNFMFTRWILSKDYGWLVVCFYSVFRLTYIKWLALNSHLVHFMFRLVTSYVCDFELLQAIIDVGTLIEGFFPQLQKKTVVRAHSAVECIVQSSCCRLLPEIRSLTSPLTV